MAKSQGGIEQVCDRLVVVFSGVVPNQGGAVKGKRPVSAKAFSTTVESGLARFYEAARVEREQSRLGVIGRARVALGLQQRLLDAGYPPALVKQVLFAMLLSAFVGKKH